MPPSAWSSRTDCLIAPPVGPSGEGAACSPPTPRSRTGSRPGGEKAARRIDPGYLNWALSGFSGYIAADELYDGPSRILSIVDDRAFKRLTRQVLDHDPTRVDIEAFLGRFHAALKARGPTLQGITTDGPALYPEPIATVFGEVPHQPRTFHVLKEGTKAVLGAVAELARGRPASKAARRAARHKKRIGRKVGDLFEHRYLFARHHLTASGRKTLTRITRGQPRLRVPRGPTEEVFRPFDRRCRTATASAKVARPRARSRRFGRRRKALKTRFAPGPEKALVFPDEKSLGSTSNAVGRGNRRYRKLRKTVYRVRTRQAIEARLALDPPRERQAQGRAETTETLHKARAA